MPKDASAVLGQQQLAAATVNPRGQFSRRMAIQGGLTGALAGRMMTGKGPAKGQNQTPRFGAVATLAVTEDELALVGRSKRGGVIARVPVSEVAGAEYRGGLVGQLTITFRSGDSWYLEASLFFKKGAKAVVAVLRDRAGVAAAA
jgi:hypothetical protein